MPVCNSSRLNALFERKNNSTDKYIIQVVREWEWFWK